MITESAAAGATKRKKAHSAKLHLYFRENCQLYEKTRKEMGVGGSGEGQGTAELWVFAK